MEATERKCEYCKLPGAQKFEAPVAFEGARKLHEWFHPDCHRMVWILRGYQKTFFALHGHTMTPMDAMLRRVVREGFTGCLDIKMSCDTNLKVIDARTRVALRPPSTPKPEGWIAMPISPEIADAIQRGLAVGEGIAPEDSDHVMEIDMDQVRAERAAAEQKEVREKDEGLA